MTLPLAQFLLNRFTEDEALAVRSARVSDKDAALVSFGGPEVPPVLVMAPDRVLADCDAKALIVMEAQTVLNSTGSEAAYQFAMFVLRTFAEQYADDPRYRDEWKS